MSTMAVTRGPGAGSRARRPAGQRATAPHGARRWEHVVTGIRELIRREGLKQGDRLPGERQLAERFGVSRGTVREAMQFLGAIGLVATRHGDGSVIRAASSSTLRNTWRDWVAKHQGRVLELIEARMGSEMLAAELAARRAGPEHLERMAEALRAMKAARDATAFVQCDLAFHSAVLQAAGNRTLREIAEALGAELVPERAALADLAGRVTRSHAEHLAIYSAIRAGDAARAREAVRAHLASVQHDVLIEVLGVEEQAPARGRKPGRRSAAGATA